VNVYSRSELRHLLTVAGFHVAALHVRKLTWEELPLIWFIHRYFRHIPRTLLRFVGKAFGWYVIATGINPTHPNLHRVKMR
jgi:tRNA(Ile)-lysidine synthase TilS/MesJ